MNNLENYEDAATRDRKIQEELARVRREQRQLRREVRSYYKTLSLSGSMFIIYTLLFHCEVLTFCIYVQRMCEVNSKSTHSMHIFCCDITMRVICGVRCCSTGTGPFM